MGAAPVDEVKERKKADGETIMRAPSIEGTAVVHEYS
jgi:hypothetical protein